MTSLAEKSRTALDWPEVLQALSSHARSLRGQELALRGQFFNSAEACRTALAEVEELESLEELGDRMPCGGLVDVRQAIETAQRGRVLDLQELSDCSEAISSLSRLAKWLEGRSEEAPRLSSRTTGLLPPRDLQKTLVESFDAPGVLSERRYPELRRLRQEITSIQSNIQRTMDELIRDPSIASLLQDTFVTRRGERAVLPIRASAKRSGLGIVHDSSASGETVFIEPTAVVELHNRKRMAEAELAREEARIRARLSQDIGAHASELLAGFDEGWNLDLVAARLGLGLALNGRSPEVGEEGIIDLKEARHPLLALQLTSVIPNNLGLSSESPGLILSGPNAGGKTVALKTMALAALFVRAGIPFPCRVGSRVDYFETVLADIGDSQALSDGLSTFSAHMLTLKTCLENASHQTLIALDELAVGTDPIQGAALARVVLQGLVQRGARVITTTHYAELKGLPAVDPRFRAGAVAFSEGQPTYTLHLGEIGLSHAFAIAEKMGLPPRLIDQARQALTEHERQWVEQSERLAEEREKLKETQDLLEAERRSLQRAEASYNSRSERLKSQREAILEEERQRLRKRYRQAEAEIKSMISQLQSQPSLKAAGETLAALRTQQLSSSPTPAPPTSPKSAQRVLREGDTVLVRSLGKTGRVCAPPRGNNVEVQIGAITTKVKATDCEPRQPSRSKPRPPSSQPSRPPLLTSTVRTDSNTLDLRGYRVDDALRKVDFFLDGLLQKSHGVAFLLHGHGTGALKKATREWLSSHPCVESWRPATNSEGGDAFTLVCLR
ncbi:MAG: Smr/MutS family protein [Myxococcota bacterium]|nr:Smr/MutS family protein [Myxococcota bacterium]